LDILLGSEALQIKEEGNGGFTEIQCDKIFPIVLNYNTSSEIMRFEMDYETKMRVNDGERNYKPAPKR